MAKKYEITEETKEYNGVMLHRIRAIKNFGSVKAGDLGGWIEKEENLSHEENAWVYGDAWVCGNAKVWGNAWVYGDAWVCGNAKVWGDAKVYGAAEVCGNAKVCGDAWVCGNAKVWGDAKVYGAAEVCGNAKVCGDAWVCGNAKVWGDAKVYGAAEVCGNAKVFSPNHVMTIGAIGSRNDFTTFYRGKDKKIMVKCGCFNDTIDKFVEKVKQTHGDNRHALVYLSAVEVAKLQIDLSDEDAESEE